MKKFLGFLMVMCMTLMIASCNGCSQPQDNQSVDSTLVDTVSIDSIPAINVDHAIATDRQAMYTNYKDDYRWYETEILLPYFMDSDSAISDPEMVVNVLQSVVERGNGADVWVHKFQHFKDGTVVHDSIQGFWIENYALNDEVIKLKYKEAWDRMMQLIFQNLIQDMLL